MLLDCYCHPFRDIYALPSKNFPITFRGKLLLLILYQLIHYTMNWYKTCMQIFHTHKFYK
jgi:hypothetical protein